MSFLDRLVWGIINSDPKRIEAKLERTRSTLEYFNSIEEQKIVDFKFGRRAWRIYKSDEKNLNNITPTEGDTINYAGSSYKLVTGFFFHHKKVSFNSDRYDIRLNVCVTNLQTNKDELLEWELPIQTMNGYFGHPSVPRLDITLDRYLRLDNVFDNITEVIENESKLIIKSGLRFGEDFNAKKLIYRNHNLSYDEGIKQETWQIPTESNLPKDEYIFFDSVLRNGPRDFGLILNETKSAEYNRQYDIEYPESEQSELADWYFWEEDQ